MYRDDGLSEGDMQALLDAFPNQSLDFFGALRCGMGRGASLVETLKQRKAIACS